MNEPSKELIGNLISYIENAEDKESVTNEIVAKVLDLLNHYLTELSGSVDTGLGDLRESLIDEIETRRLEDEEIKKRQSTADFYITDLQTSREAIRVAINDIINRFNSLVGANASEAIDNFNEILRFLDGLKDTDSLKGLLSELRRGIKDNENALSAHRTSQNRHLRYVSYEAIDTVDCANPGVYTLKETDGGYGETEDESWGRWWYMVCSWGKFLGNDIDPDYVNTAFQTLFGDDGIRFRTGRIEGFDSSGMFTGVSWDEWQPLSESLPDISRRLGNLEKVAEKFRVIPVSTWDDFNPDNHTVPGWYYLTLPGGLEDVPGPDAPFMLVVTRTRLGGGTYSLFQWCYTSLGIKLRHGRQDKYGTAWEPFQTIGGGSGQPELGITYYTDAEIDAIAAASENEAEV